MAKNIEFKRPEDLVIVGLDTGDGEDHPLYDERINLPENEVLQANIRTYGILQPVLVREEAGVLLVVDGRQRVRAARAIAAEAKASGTHAPRVPCVRKKGEDSTMMGIMITTNEMRQEDKMFAKARKAARLLATLGEVNEVALAFGVSPTAVRNWLSLLEADESVKSAVQSGVISATAGVKLSKLPRPEQAAALEKLLSGVVQTSTSAPAPAPIPPAVQAAVAGLADPLIPPSTPAPTPPAAPARPAASKSRTQAGIKRVWLRKALKTTAATALTDEQRALLNWFVTGTSDAGTWYDDFRWEAEAEMEET